jgi:hypothetical protein
MQCNMHQPFSLSVTGTQQFHQVKAHHQVLYHGLLPTLLNAAHSVLALSADVSVRSYETYSQDVASLSEASEHCEQCL